MLLLGPWRYFEGQKRDAQQWDLVILYKVTLVALYMLHVFVTLYEVVDVH